jgi:hypothetical protein
MTMAVFSTEHEAQQDMALRAARYPRWRFRVATVVSEDN